MGDDIRVWFKDRAEQAINSIAFYPTFIGLLFVLFSWAAITFDFSEAGMQIKQNYSWLTLKDAASAQSIVSAIASGVITLTVFNFSMVMIVLNQAASQLSNRVLTELIGNRFQQMVLGIYIGTIVFAFALLSTIRSTDTGIHVPALSTYLLILLTVIDIFIFIYFLHYITQSVRYEIIIERIYLDTIESLQKDCYLPEPPPTIEDSEEGYLILLGRAGVYEGVDLHQLLIIAHKNDCIFSTIHLPGTYLLAGMPVLKANKLLSERAAVAVRDALLVHTRESIDNNYFYGLRQLMEIAVKALSPGINDPGTAILSLRYIFNLFSYRITHFPAKTIQDKENEIRVVIQELTFEKIFESTLLPIWEYGHEDRLIQHELRRLLIQLQTLHPSQVARDFLHDVEAEISQSDFSKK